MRFIFLLILIASLFSGCSFGIRNKVYNNISEMVDFVVVGANEKVSVSLMCGRREVSYKIDGKSTELIPYGILTLNLNEQEMDINMVTYVLFVGTHKYQGDMQKNPYDNTWVIDIKNAVNKDENISVNVFVDDENYSLKLKSIDDDWVLSSSDVVDILIREYKENLEKMLVDGVFDGEVYVKIISDGEYLDTRYYYYVSVVGKNGGGFNFLLSPTTKEILASNNIAM